MAGGQLVPHTLPDGRTVMVPDYLVPSGAGALAMPSVPKPAGPDLRTADASAMLGAASPQFQQVLDASRGPVPGASPLAMTPVAPTEDAEQRLKRQDAERATQEAKEQGGKADPKKLKPVPKADPRAESDVITSTASDLYKPKPGGSGPAKPDPQNMQLVAAEVKQERTPGMNLLPELRQRYGLEERPDLGQEVDPTAVQPTWGDADPVMRERLSPLNRAVKEKGATARADFERQERDRAELALAERQALADQSSLIDEQLRTIADRRDRIARLQETADKRMQEAESFEPRTREQVWEDKGALAQGMGILAMAIGGYTQGLGRNGGKNPGLDMVNKVLDDAVEGERYKAEGRRKLGIEAKNDYERAFALYGDLDMAKLDAKNRKLSSVLGMAKQQAASRGLDATAKQRADQFVTEFEMQLLMSAQQLNDLAEGKVTKEEATLKPYGQVAALATPKATGGGGGTAGGVTGDKLKGLSSEIRAMAVKLPDGRYKFVRQPTQQGQTQKRVSSLGEMGAVLRQIQAWRQDKGKTLPLSEARGKIANAAARFTMLVKGSEQLGALDKGTMDFMIQMLGSPEQFNVADATTDGKIAQQLDTVNRNLRKVVEEELDDGPFDLTEGGVTPDEVRD